MPETKTSVLIVEDVPSLRTVLSLVLASSGYTTQTAEEGFSALVEIRHSVPDFLISDLNMPKMSGFELLKVVRREFPSIRVIAMSGAFSGDEIPPGAEADAFYQKGRGPGVLLKMMKSLPLPDRIARSDEQDSLLPYQLEYSSSTSARQHERELDL